MTSIIRQEIFSSAASSSGSGEEHELISIQRLIPSERISLEHARCLALKIQIDGFWLTPIAIEENYEVVMDGHHRLHAASLLCLGYVPVVRWSYGRVPVTAWISGLPLDPDSLLRDARDGCLLPPKSTRHAFPSSPSCRIPLSVLRVAPRPHC